MYSSSKTFFSYYPFDKIPAVLNTAIARKAPVGLYKICTELAKSLARHLKSRGLFVQLADGTYALNKAIEINDDVWETAIEAADDELESFDTEVDRYIRRGLSIPKVPKTPKEQPAKEVQKKVRPLSEEQIEMIRNNEARHKALDKLVKRFGVFRGVTQLDETSASLLDQIVERANKLKALPRETEDVPDQGLASPASVGSIWSEPRAFDALVEREERLNMDTGVMQSEYELQLRQKEDEHVEDAIRATSNNVPEGPADPEDSAEAEEPQAPAKTKFNRRQQKAAAAAAARKAKAAKAAAAAAEKIDD